MIKRINIYVILLLLSVITITYGANEIYVSLGDENSGLEIGAAIRQPSTKYLFDDVNGFEQTDPDPNCGIDLTEDANMKGWYVGDAPGGLPAGRFDIVVFDSNGASLDINDTQIMAFEFNWDGSAEITNYSLWIDVNDIKAKTDNLPSDPADDSDIDDQLVAMKTVVDDANANVSLVLVDTSAYDTDAEYAMAIWNALTDSFGSMGSYGAMIEGWNTKIVAISNDTAMWDTTAEARTMLTGSDTPLSTLISSDNIGINWDDVSNPTSTVGLSNTSVGLIDDAITSAKFDESTAYPLAKPDADANELARTGADGDTLETLSDQIDDVNEDTNEMQQTRCYK